MSVGHIIFGVYGHADHIPFSAVGLKTAEYPFIQIRIVSMVQMYDHFRFGKDGLDRIVSGIGQSRIRFHADIGLAGVPEHPVGSLVAYLHPFGGDAFIL